MRRMSQYRSPSAYRSSYYEAYSSNTSPYLSRYDLDKSYDETNYSTSPRPQRSSRRQSYLSSAFIPNISLYNNDEPIQDYSYTNNADNTYSGGLLNGFCSECEEYRHLVQCLSHCNLIICEVCRDKHWQNEINELIQIKTQLEDNVSNMRKYLESKRRQCNENIKSCQQIKKFITMTMQQIKRKIELELENKRDELYDTIDTFIENQKKIGQSINEDGFVATDRICNEIENMILTAGNEMNFFKIKTVKGLANLQAQKLEKQNSRKIPFYSIFFVPDSTVQVQNSFGKIVLKSYEEGDDDDLIENASNNIFDNKTNNYENKPLKNKIIDQIKNEKLQKWNSAESLNLNSKKLQLSSMNPDLLKNTQNNSNYSSTKTVNLNDRQIYEENETPRGSSPESPILVSDYNKLPKHRNQSQPAPITKLRLKKADTAIYSPSPSQSGHSSTDDYFKSFKSIKKPEIQNDYEKSDSEDDIVSI